MTRGQSALERSGRINNLVVNVNIKEESLVLKKIVKNHIIANGCRAELVTIHNNLIYSVTTVRKKLVFQTEKKIKKQQKVKGNRCKNKAR